MMNIYAQLSPQPLQPLGSSEIPKDVIKDQISQIMDNKSEDHIKSLENTSKKCDKKKENIELKVCSSENDNKINSDPFNLFVDISNKTQ